MRGKLKQQQRNFPNPRPSLRMEMPCLFPRHSFGYRPNMLLRFKHMQRGQPRKNQGDAYGNRSGLEFLSTCFTISKYEQLDAALPTTAAQIQCWNGEYPHYRHLRAAAKQCGRSNPSPKQPVFHESTYAVPLPSIVEGGVEKPARVAFLSQQSCSLRDWTVSPIFGRDIAHGKGDPG